MKRTRTTDGLARENARLRRERNDARAAAAALRRTLAEQERVLHGFQLESIERRLEGRLALEDFTAFIGLPLVVDAGGQIDAWQLEQHVAALIARRPRLALMGPPPTDVRGAV